MPIDDKLETGRRSEQGRRHSAKPRALVGIVPGATRVGRAAGERGTPVGVQPPKRADGRRVPQHLPPPPVTAILDLPKAVPVLDVRAPPAQRARPGTYAVIDADFPAEDVATPAVVVPGEHHDAYARLAEIGESREYAERAPRDHVLPLEPEVEEVTVDHERPGAVAERAKKIENVAVHRRWRDAEMRVREDVTGRRKHADILAQRAYLYNCAERIGP